MAVAEELEQLQRQAALLVEGLASPALPREQRRVQGRLLTQTRREVEQHQRAVQAVEAGYAPFQPSPEWLWGYLDDPRLFHGHARLAAAIAALPLSVAAAAAMVLAMHIEALAASLTALVLLIGLQTVLHAAIGRGAEDRTKVAGPIRIFNSAMPPAAVTAFRQAQRAGLFDTFAVYSPRAADFREVQADRAPSLGLLDPVLAGRIGDQEFLIAQWDLGRDLAIA